MGDLAFMEITRDEVLHVAKLARLALSEEEVERFRGQLSAILEAVGKVSELDLEGVPPTSHRSTWSTFSPRTSPRRRSREEALANAPDPEDGFFGVPPV